MKEERKRKEREAQREAGEQGQTATIGKIMAKPPPQLEKDVTVDELDLRICTWNDYYRVVGLDKQTLRTQRANLF